MILIRKTYSIEKKAALKKASLENETKELIDLAPSRVFLILKAAIKNAKKMTFQEIFFISNLSIPLIIETK